MTRYRWVASRKAEGFPTAVSCRIAGVGRQAFYDWSDRQARGSSLKELATAELVDEIRRIHSDSGGAYGSPRVTAVLRRQGRRVNHKRVERLMRVNGICGIYKRRKPRFRPAAGVCSTPDDLVRRDFGPGRPDTVWAGDITYIATGQGWLHLAVVLDIGSRRVIGYSMAADMPARLVIDALNTAAASRSGRTTGVIFHSDRERFSAGRPPPKPSTNTYTHSNRPVLLRPVESTQYLSGDFASALRRHGMRQSVGRVGNCLLTGQ